MSVLWNWDQRGRECLPQSGVVDGVPKSAATVLMAEATGDAGSMFEHMTVLLSIIFALAMTHILASVTELVWERSRVRFSGLHSLWMANALFGLLCYWVSIWDLTTIKHWSGPEVALQFFPAIVQYFACSLLSMPREGDGVLDMRAFFERQRPAIFTAFSLMWVLSIIGNYIDRNNSSVSTASSWIGTDVPLVFMLIATLMAGWARALWLQWTAGVFIFGLEVLFLATYHGRL